MKGMAIVLLMIAVLVSLAGVSAPQDLKGNSMKVVVQPSDSRPELRADLNANAQAKVFFPRKRYRLGELVKAAVGLRLTNTSEYYFKPDFEFRLIIIIIF